MLHVVNISLLLSALNAHVKFVVAQNITIFQKKWLLLLFGIALK